ncbi:MAG TPA: hypothetical protein VIW72_02070 [Burkholderiales bacterium]
MQSGFLLVTAIFLLVILAALGAFILTISGTQQTGSALDVQGSRAYQAARAGIEWGSYQVLNAGATYVQSKSATSALASPLTTIVVSFTSVVTSGHTVAGFVTWGSDITSDLTSVTDDKGNTYTIVRRTHSLGGFNQSIASFYLQNIINSPQTITATFSPARPWRGIAVHEISGLSATPLDQETGQAQTTPGTGANAVTSGPVTTTKNGDYIIAGTTECSSSRALPQYTQGTGYTKREEVGSISTQNLATEDQVQASAAAISGTFTQTANDNTCIHIMTFMAAVGPADGAYAAACSPGPTTQNVTGMGGTLSGFTAAVTCSSSTYTEGSATWTVYQITSTGAQGTAGTLDRVERQLQVTLIK